MKYFIFALWMSLLSSCANPINEITYYRYLETGSLAELRNDPVLAEVAFNRALANVYMGNLDKKIESQALFNLGRMERVNGKLDLSIEHLLKALRIDENLKPINNEHLIADLSEIAKTYYEKNQYKEGSIYMDRIISIMESITDKNVFTGKAKRFMNRLFLEYAEKIKQMGLDDKAKKYSEFARELKSYTNPTMVSRGRFTTCGF